MQLPAIHGLIDRRILVNFRIDPQVAARVLPPPFVPKLANGYAMGGICLIRLKSIRPRWFPISIGIGSENAAHRFAVEWDQDGKREEGVFVERRDSSSRLNSLVGGRLVPGVHHHAHFDVNESDDRLRVQFTSDDRQASASVDARICAELPKDSIFASVREASRFFESGALGYSVTSDPNRFDGLELRCKSWSVQSLAVDSVQSSFFDDRSKFPAGSTAFDCALLMRGIPHEWHSLEDLHCPACIGAGQ